MDNQAQNQQAGENVSDQSAAVQAPTVEQKEASQNEANLQKAIAGGYKEPVAVSLEDRKAALYAEMQHAVAHNGPITQAMLAEVRELLGIAE